MVRTTIFVGFLQDHKETRDLLSRSNISRPALEQYAREAATFATNGKLGKLELALKDGKENDVAIFDFTSFFAAKHAARIVEKKGKKILLALAGDSLLEVQHDILPIAAGILFIMGVQL